MDDRISTIAIVEPTLGAYPLNVNIEFYVTKNVEMLVNNCDDNGKRVDSTEKLSLFMVEKSC